MLLLTVLKLLKGFFQGLSKHSRFKLKAKHDKFTIDNNRNPIRLD